MARRMAGVVHVASTKPIIFQHQNRTREELAYKRSSSSFISSHVHYRAFSTRRTNFSHLRLLGDFIPSIPSFSQVFAYFVRLRGGDILFSSLCVPTRCSPRFIGQRHLDGDATGVAVHTLAAKCVCVCGDDCKYPQCQQLTECTLRRHGPLYTYIFSFFSACSHGQGQISCTFSAHSHRDRNRPLTRVISTASSLEPKCSHTVIL